MIVISVVNTKGGTGKTTLAAALAVRAAEESKRVALVDLDPQASLTQWWHQRGQSDNPCVLQGVDSAGEAVERLAMTGWDWVFIDSPPAFLAVVQDAIEVADFTIIPVKPTKLDMMASEDAVVIATEAGADYLIVVNDVVGNEKMHERLQQSLLNQGLPIADRPVRHRMAHMQAMNVGKSASEVKASSAKTAAEDIEVLWREVRRKARRAAKQRAEADS